MNEDKDKKPVSIIVNGTQKFVPKETISFDELVELAYGPNPEKGPDIEYTITYAKGPDDRKEGKLTEGQSVKVKDGMIFNVYKTNKS